MRRKKLPKLRFAHCPMATAWRLRATDRIYVLHPGGAAEGRDDARRLKMTEELSKDNIEAFIKSSIQLDSLKLCNKEIAKLKREGI